MSDLPKNYVWQWPDGTILREGADRVLIISDSWRALEIYVHAKHGNCGHAVPYDAEKHGK